MRHPWRTTVALVMAILFSALVGTGRASEGLLVSPRPPGAEPLTVALPDTSVYLFRDSKFRGNTTRLGDILATPAAMDQELANVHGVSSARWSLPPGVLVVLYAKSAGRGSEVFFWGKGQLESLNKWHFNDKASNWAWYYVGGVPNFRPPLQQTMQLFPAGAGPTDGIAPGSIEFYKDADLRGTLTTAGPVTQFPANTLHSAGKAAGTMSSVRWDLPPGVIVVLYEDAKAKGRRLLLFGSGQYDSVSAWNFNDKLSYWAWYDIAGGR
ncbi:MAG: hypothetical protein ACM359_18220 [Bacillota bacterium]